jgi:hypothetical protein
VIVTQNSSAAFGICFADALERGLTCLSADTKNRKANGARQRHVSAASAMFLLLRWIELDRLVSSRGVCVQRYSSL